MKKATRITYNPFSNSLGFEIAQSTDGPWTDLSDGSDLLKYANQLVLFSNCVSDVVSIVNDKHNSVREGLEIQFCGPTSDFKLLKKAVEKEHGKKKGVGPLTCVQIGTFRDSNETLTVIRENYEKISSEFVNYLPGTDYYNTESRVIGDVIVKFEETVSDAVPVCVIGNYSVGKSALLNSLIGAEVLPSKGNPSTAKNVKIVGSERYAITLAHSDGKSDVSYKRFLVEKQGLEPDDGDKESVAIAKRLNTELQLGSTNEKAVIRTLLDALNEGHGHHTEDEYLSAFGTNVVIELPFNNSLLDNVNNKIVFYDTPGNDNTEVDQVDHLRALHELLGEQTNALPLLVTERNRISGTGVGDVMHLLDEYAENFSSPSCLVVLTKCDNLSKTELEEPVSSGIRNWHGKSLILFTTPIGALGERKSSDETWLDESYKELFEKWRAKQLGPKRISLPEYNCYPCERRGTKEDTGVDSDLYNTGIPSLEYELLYYIDNYANYKKCVRGRKDLLDALETVKRELDARKIETAKAKDEAERRKAGKRSDLLEELDAIQLTMPNGLDVEMASYFAEILNDYCASLSETMEAIYAELDKSDPLSMDKEFNELIRDHCQKELISKVYLAADGAKTQIVDKMSAMAESYANELQEYVSKNKSHFSDYGIEQLRQYLNKDIESPEFTEVNSVLENIEEILEKAALLQHGVLRLTNNEEAARENWIASKAKSFEARLKGKKNIFGRETPGLFLSTVFSRPLANYFEQLSNWCNSYKSYIKAQLDQDNVLLSDLEEEIEVHESIINDLESRLGDIKEVELVIKDILEPEEMRV